MRKVMSLLTMLIVSFTVVGCAHLPGSTDLDQVARDNGLAGVTTGDGGFDSYEHSGIHYKSTEVGIAVGIPFLLKLIEVFPMQSNEAQLGQIAQDAKGNGADALVNVDPPNEFYTGFPFFIVGLYIDRAEGTGVTMK